MPEPILPRGIRAQVVMPAKTGRPEDRFVNTWHFQVPGANATEEDEVDVATQVKSFYQAIPTGQANPIQAFISSAVDKPLCEVRTYRLGLALPREPTIHPFSMGIGSEANFPEEVAVCCSFYSVRNLPRQRGRIFVGPLTKSTGENEASSNRCRVTPTFKATVVGAALALAQVDNALRPHWCVLSKVAGALHPVTNGWVDDSFDTQRRRGAIALVRTGWGPVAQ